MSYLRKCPLYLWIDTPQAYARSILILPILLGKIQKVIWPVGCQIFTKTIWCFRWNVLYLTITKEFEGKFDTFDVYPPLLLLPLANFGFYLSPTTQRHFAAVALDRFNIINANQGNSHNACKHYYLSSVERGGFNPLIVKTCEYCHFIREGCRKKIKCALLQKREGGATTVVHSYHIFSIKVGF